MSGKRAPFLLDSPAGEVLSLMSQENVDALRRVYKRRPGKDTEKSC